MFMHRIPLMKIRRFLFILNIFLLLISFSLFSSKVTMLLFSTYQKSDDRLRQPPDAPRTIDNGTFTLADSVTPRYLWCLTYHGPNNQLKSIIKCSIIAKMVNLTVVIPPLFPHYLDKTKSIQNFLHFYDLEALTGWFKFITFENFIQQVQTIRKKAMVDCYIREIGMPSWVEYHAGITLRPIEDHYQTKINFYRHVNLSKSPSLKDLDESAKKCTSIFLQSDYEGFRHLVSAQHIHVQRFFQQFHRTTIIQRMASHMISLLHESAIDRHSRNNLTSLAVAHMRLGDRVVLSVPMYTMQILQLIQSGVQFQQLHVMCPYLSSADMNHLTNNLPIAITTTTMLFRHVYRALDDYMFDVLEQEIAVQAAVFIASPWSTYSSTVVLQKLHQNKGIVYTFSDKGENRTFAVNKNNAIYYFK